MIKHSKQRDCIQEFLEGRYDHPTAETVYLNIRKEFPRISLATVYRNLSLLSDLGEIQKIATGNGPDRFDGNPRPHNHFICNCCGSVLDLEMESIEHINEIAAKTFQGKIEGHTIIFYGTCPECLKEQQTKNIDQINQTDKTS